MCKEPRGLERDFLIRYLIVRDEFWWKLSDSPWRMNLMHPPHPQQIDPETGEAIVSYKVSEWRDRVLDLCEFEITHQYFGLSYSDLMNLDTAEFEDIEDRVHKIAAQKTQHLNKLKADISGKQQPSSTNILKDLHR